MTLSALVTLIVVIVVLGFALYLIEAYVPMAAPFKLAVRFIIVLAVVLYLLTVIGVWHGFGA